MHLFLIIFTLFHIPFSSIFIPWHSTHDYVNFMYNEVIKVMDYWLRLLMRCVIEILMMGHLISLGEGKLCYTSWLLYFSLHGDPGVYWWPSTKSTWTSTIVSFNFSVSLIVAQFIIFSSFSSLELPALFWRPKQRSFGKMGETWVHRPMLLFPKL